MLFTIVFFRGRVRVFVRGLPSNVENYLYLNLVSSSGKINESRKHHVNMSKVCSLNNEGNRSPIAQCLIYLRYLCVISTRLLNCCQLYIYQLTCLDRCVDSTEYEKSEIINIKIITGIMAVLKTYLHRFPRNRMDIQTCILQS